ncbi:hypothetical protein [Haliangium sp.]|uniref:hypothetical protein n=1 Tax=Haliangium sp. TaxID=2663208 RepID=UPI003D13CD9C
MPVRPENKLRYPANWSEISKDIKERAGWRCECTGQCGEHEGRRCVELHGHRAVRARGQVVLTTAHLDHQPENCAAENLLAMCQRCHLRYDIAHHAETRRRTRDARSGQLGLYEFGLGSPPPVCAVIDCLSTVDSEGDVCGPCEAEIRANLDDWADRLELWHRLAHAGLTLLYARPERLRELVGELEQECRPAAPTRRQPSRRRRHQPTGGTQ